MLFTPDDQELKLIYTIDEKIEALSKTGLQNLVVHVDLPENSQEQNQLIL